MYHRLPLQAVPVLVSCQPDDHPIVHLGTIAKLGLAVHLGPTTKLGLVVHPDGLSSHELRQDPKDHECRDGICHPAAMAWVTDLVLAGQLAHPVHDPPDRPAETRPKKTGPY